jgi:hypothetical protein
MSGCSIVGYGSGSRNWERLPPSEERQHLICSDAGADRVDGGGADDQLFGGTDGDTLLGSNGEDSLSGGSGGDVLRGDEDETPCPASVGTTSFVAARAGTGCAAAPAATMSDSSGTTATYRRRTPRLVLHCAHGKDAVSVVACGPACGYATSDAARGTATEEGIRG